MVVFIAVILVFSIAGMGVFHLNISTTVENTQRARNLAESAMAQAIEKIIADETFGSTSYTGNKTIDIPVDSSQPQTSGMLTFDTVTASQRGIPHSTNNLDSDVAVNGFNRRTVPPYSFHIVGTGICRGSKCNVEAIIHVPQFPYSIASSGKFHSQGNLLVASVENFDDIAQGLSGTLDPKRLRQGHLVANNSNPDAVKLEGQAKITGNLRTSGEVQMLPGTQSSILILGETLTHADPVSIKAIDISSYDPTGKAGVNSLGRILDNPELAGFCKAASSLTICGNVSMQGGLLYVNGDLNVTGKVNGRGAIVTTGKTTVGKGTDLSTDNQVALLSGDDVTLGGSNSTDYSSFQGLVYNQGNFTADHINLCGNFICAGHDSSVASSGSTSAGTTVSSMALHNAQVMQFPGYEEFDAVSVTGEPPKFRIGDMIHHITENLEATVGSNPNVDPVQADIEYQQANFHECSIVPVTHQYKGKQTTGYFVQIKVTNGSRPNSTMFCKNYQELEKNFLRGYCKLGPEFGELGVQYAIGFINTYLAGQRPPPGQPPPPRIEVNLVEIDLSEFISMKDRVQVILWRDL